MKYRPKIGAGDFDTKTRKVEQFLGEGHKVKVTIMFRGREMQHPELGRKILDQVAEAVVDTGRVEVYPKLDGRNMTMVLGPDKKAQAAAEKRRQAETEAGAAGADQPSHRRPGHHPRSPRHRGSRDRPRLRPRSVEAPAEAADTDRGLTPAEPTPDPHAGPPCGHQHRRNPNAQDEDPPRRHEALQDHRHRQDHAPQGEPATTSSRRSPPTRKRRLTGDFELAPGDAARVTRQLGI